MDNNFLGEEDGVGVSSKIKTDKFRYAKHGYFVMRNMRVSRFKTCMFGVSTLARVQV